MKTFFKDYGDLCKATGQFYKKHWLGTIVMNVVAVGATALVFWPKEMKKEVADSIKGKFKKNGKGES